MKWMVCLLVALLVVSFHAQVKAQNLVHWPWGQRTGLVSVDLVDGKLHVVTRTPSGGYYPEGGGEPDVIRKYIYAASNGVVVLEREVKGMVIPAQTTQERIEWPDAESQKVPHPVIEIPSWVATIENVAMSYSNTMMVVTNSQVKGKK